MAYPERLLSPGESILKQFRPHWQVLVMPAVITLVAGGLAGIAASALDGGSRSLVLLVIAGAWLILVIGRVAVWLTTWYVITNERVIFRAGVFARRGKEIPLEVINDVAFRQSFLERVVKSGDLLIESAGEMGQSRFTDIPEPEDIQSVIYQARETRSKHLSGGARSVASELEGLARLRDQGILSAEEFENQKRKLLES